ncbi:hypothetical protein OAP99_01550 [Flavobacteriaceae bacterium]|nr:hypothetical protein [Flavobacteriaceae bacterium]
MNLYIAIALGVVTGAIGAYIAEQKNRPHLQGFLLGFFFGLIGILLVLLLSKKEESN